MKFDFTPVEIVYDLDEEISWFLEDFNDMVVSSEKTAEEKAQYY